MKRSARVAKAGWNLEQLRARAKDSLEKYGGGADRAAFGKLMELLKYVDGDYREPQTFDLLRKALDSSVCSPWTWSSMRAPAIPASPSNPSWWDRDRFFLSAGHGSALLYSLLHLTGHFTHALASDGDMMEGVQSEAVSLAGHLGLGRLIVLYDNNHVTLSATSSTSHAARAAWH